MSKSTTTKKNLLTSDDLRTMTDDIMKSEIKSEKQRQAFYKDKYPALHAGYPGLLDMCCSQGEGARRVLDMMLSELTRMEQNEVSQFDASKTVGEALSQRYIEPLLNKKNEAQ